MRLQVALYQGRRTARPERQVLAVKNQPGNPVPSQSRARKSLGFSLPEVVISLMVVGLGVAGTVTLYVQAGTRAEWSAYSYSAQMMALRGVEQARAAKYDPRGSPPTDQLVSTNFPNQVDVLDVGAINGALTYGTNVITISQVRADPPLKMVRVDCTWSFPRKGVFTNTIVTYRAANQ